MEDIKVLIVDDSALMRSLIGKIVDGTPGLTVADKAMNGRFALQKLERVQPDIIVLDLEMPEMNGIEFCGERKGLILIFRNHSVQYCKRGRSYHNGLSGTWR